VRRRSLLKTIAALPVTTPLRGQPGTRAWLGPDHWANPLQDWRRAGDRIECHVSGGDRNVYWLTREISQKNPMYRMSVRVGRLSPAKDGWVGFRTGMQGHFSDYRDTAVRGIGIESGITADGKLFIGRLKSDTPAIAPSLEDVTLTLEAAGPKLRLSAAGATIEDTIPAEWTSGGVALVCHAGEAPSALPRFAEPQGANAGKPNQQRGGDVRFWFRDWALTGPGVVNRPERAFGPILFTQYTLSHGILKMTVQLAPAEGDEPAVELRIKAREPLRSQIEPYSSTASFRVENWRSNRDVPFEIAFQNQTYAGVVRREPTDKSEIVVGSLTCQGDFGFPHSEIARNLRKLNPDILFFTGDQLYEANGGYAVQRQPLQAARLDYLRKWYMFGWAWGEFTRNTPCVCLPDDHDVYHGNVWGAGGRRAEFEPVPEGAPPNQQSGQDSGGYTMPAQWVNMVQRTQSSHLPDSPDPRPIEQNIAVNYGHLIWGGISFAIIEDRKWKSAPKPLMPEAKIRNGWPQNADWDSAKQGDVPGAQLLGERQERFLAQWATDWPDDVEMKAVVSQTIFCNLGTLPAGMTSDAGTPKLPIQPLGGYSENEHLTEDHDSNGWPQTPRNRALRLMRSCLAVHLAGDQHLASTVQYGIDDFNDGPYSLCSPAISNIFPRRWFPPQPGANRKPGAPRNSGEYLDGFGNHMTVHAVANPQQFGMAPAALNNRAPGFGIAYFNKKTRQIRLENWPRWADVAKDRPFPGWPITIDQIDNGLNGARWELRLPSKLSGLITVSLEKQDHPVLIWRTAGAIDHVRVWQRGEYTIQAGAQQVRVNATRRRMGQNSGK
jgi:hypothetical protein